MTELYVSKGFFPEDYFAPTIDYIVRTQQVDGAIPSHEGGPLDPWDHVEAAMGLTIGGRLEEARHAYRWMQENQLPNGSWLAAYKDGKVEDGTRAESNFVAYVATGVYHHYLVTGDKQFLAQMWDTVRDAIEFVLRLQGPKGEIYWCEDTRLGIREDSLITGCSSIHKSLQCAVAIARVMGEERDDWALARDRLGTALTDHPECFDRTWDSKTRFAMDWFYPVLTQVVTGKTAAAHLKARWDEFVRPNLGCVCVHDEPWVTVAESCELAMALAATGDHSTAVQLFSWLHKFRDSDGCYWTGYVYPDDAIWPVEKPTWTAGAVLLAADALSGKTAASRLFLERVIPPNVASMNKETRDGLT